MTEILVIAVGYSRMISESSMEANCSCVLVKDNGINIIVDTMTAWDSNFIRSVLSRENVLPDEINFVVNTHGHSDHSGCNYLFQKATHITGNNISHRDLYTFHDFNTGGQIPILLISFTVYLNFSGCYQITNNVRVISSPGHTPECVSVIVENCKGLGCVVISGDTFEREEDIRDSSVWQSAGSFNEIKQRLSRYTLSTLADYIIPGHGPMFRMSEEYRELLREQNQ